MKLSKLFVTLLITGGGYKWLLPDFTSIDTDYLSYYVCENKDPGETYQLYSIDDNTNAKTKLFSFRCTLDDSETWGIQIVK